MKPVRTSTRGSALVELAIVLPLLVAVLLYSLFFTELIGAKLRLLEASRFAAWELTAHPLSDFGRGAHDRAFELASRKTLSETRERFARIGPATDRADGSFVASFEDFDLRLHQSPPSRADSEVGERVGGGVWGASVLGALSGGLGAVLRTWKFNDEGRVSVETSMRLTNRFLPSSYLDRSRGAGFFNVNLFGGRSLSTVPLKSRLTLIADSWTLSDGGDAMMRVRRAGWHRSGSHPSGLYLQVSRMTFLGLRNRLEHAPALGSIAGFLRGLAPDPTGTFVVSHNYGPDPGGDWARRCNNLPGYPPGAIGGLNNLSRFSQLDDPRPDCFDSAPFRDQSRYEDSLYLRIFNARGSWFMGCKNPGADDPSAPNDVSSGDQAQKVDCE